MARVRAVENRRWLLRVTNNGYTASVDPYGRIYEPLPTDVRASADLPYDFRTDRTIYTRFGDWFAWLCVAVSAILLASTFWKGNVSRDSIPIPVDFLASPIRVVPDAVYIAFFPMIIEDLQHKYEGLKQRITLVRSYL